MKDKLNTLIELTKTKKIPYFNPIEELFKSLRFNEEAFLFLYENLDESDKPNFKSHSFAIYFWDIIKEKDDNIFNHYFFSGLHNIIDINDIRKEQIKRIENIPLKDFIVSMDKPKKIDEIINVLAELWESKSERYEIMFQEYLPKLKQLATISSKKSRAAYNFSNWARKISDRYDLIYLFNFCESLELDPFKFSIATDKNFKTHFKNLSIDGWKKLIEYSNDVYANNISDANLNKFYPDTFTIIEKITGFNHIVKTLIKLAENNQTEKFTLLWTTQQESIRNCLNTSFFKDPNISNIEFMEKILQKSKESIGYRTRLGIEEYELISLIKYSKYIDLEVNLKHNAISVKKIKI